MRAFGTNPAAATLLRGALVFDGERFREGRGLLVAGGMIRRLAPLGEFAGFGGRICDVPGTTLLPGLIDCHVHLVLSGAANVQAGLRASQNEQFVAMERAAAATLEGGVTTVRDLGSFSKREPALRDAISRGEVAGPSIIAAGFITNFGGHGAWFDPSVQVEGPEAARRKVRDYAAMDLDWIKIVVSGGMLTKNSDPLATALSLDEISAITSEAIRLGRKVAAHALGAEGVHQAVVSGVASIEHGIELTDDIIGDMVERGVVLVPTLSAAHALIEAARRGFALAPDLVEKLDRFGEMHRHSFRRFASAGGRVAMGTDAGTPFNFHGHNSCELRLMVENGLSVSQALRAATAHAADLLEGRMGRLQDGAPADLLILGGDVRRSIECVADKENHVAVLKGGTLVDRHNRPNPAPVIRAIRDGGPSF